MSFSIRQIDRLKEIQRLVCHHYEIPLDEMLSQRRPNWLAHPRMMAMYLVRRETNLSLVEIGQRFGGRDHATVIYACKRIKQAIATLPSLNDVIKKIMTGEDPAQLN